MASNKSPAAADLAPTSKTERTVKPTPAGNAAIDRVKPNIQNPRAATAGQAAAQRASANNPLFHSLDGTEIHVSLPNGSKAIVGATPRTLPKQFWREAQKAGCVTSQMADAIRSAPKAGIEDDPIQRKAAVKAAIKESLEMDAESDEAAEAFTPSGLPNASWVSTKVGFAVSRSERDDVWNELQVEAEKNDEQIGENGKTRDSDDASDNA